MFSVNAADGPALGTATPLQNVLNAMPAIPIAGNNLKFQFGGDVWIATVNGENFSAGTIVVEDTDTGSILTLKQTHIWPGAVGKTAGRVASVIPGGGAVGGALNAAGTIAGAAGAVEASGPEIVLEYKSGPPAKLIFVRSTNAKSDTVEGTSAENKFDLDGFNVFAISLTGVPMFPPWLNNSGGISTLNFAGGMTFTLFEKYKPNAFFSPSYFLSGKYIAVYNTETDSDFIDIGAGVLFKHRFPKNRVLWNLGASLEFLWVKAYKSVDYTYTYTPRDNGNAFTGSDSTSYATYYNNNNNNISFLLGMGIQTGFSFRLNRYTSLDLNWLLKFPFGTVDLMKNKDFHWHGYIIENPDETARYNAFSRLPEYESVWPFTGGFELGFTFWIPYKSRKQK